MQGQKVLYPASGNTRMAPCAFYEVNDHSPSHQFFSFIVLEAISKMPNRPISSSGLNRNPQNI
jgi:hypothetical protein